MKCGHVTDVKKTKKQCDDCLTRKTNKDIVIGDKIISLKLI